MATNEFTKEELIIVWLNRFEKNNKQLAEIIPNRTPKSIKHVLGRFRKIAPEDEIFLVENAETLTAREIDAKRNLPPSSSSSYFKMRGIEYLLRPESYTKNEIDTFNQYKGEKTYKEIAGILGVTEKRIIGMAHNFKMKTKFVWTEDKVEDVVSRLDRGEAIEAVAEAYGRKRQAVIVLLRKKGLYKYIPKSYSNKYVASKPELYIMNRIEQEFGIVLPKKCRENADYYWGIIPPYEVDIPFYIGNHKFAIEYGASYWHNSDTSKERDNKKKELLIEKGFHYFSLTSDMHKHGNLKTMDPILDNLCEFIKNDVLKTKERSTTSESITSVSGEEASSVGPSGR